MLETINVVMPCAGNGIYFEEALDSVLNQSVLPNKIYVVDNVSGHDGYYNIVKSKNNNLIEYTKLSKRLSMTENWQYCLGLGTSTYFAFLHDDDIWDIDYLKIALSSLSNNPDASISLSAFCSFNSSFDKSELIKYTKNNDDVIPDNIRAYILSTTSASHMSAIIFRRKSVGFAFHSRWMADQNFFSSYLFYYKFIFISEINAYIRLSNSSLTSKVNSQGFISVETISHLKNVTESYIRNKHLTAKELLMYIQNNNNGYLKRLKQACFSWPLSPSLLTFGFDLIKYERILRRAQNIPKFLIILYCIKWIVLSFCADFKYFFKDFFKNNNGKI